MFIFHFSFLPCIRFLIPHLAPSPTTISADPLLHSNWSSHFLSGQSFFLIHSLPTLVFQLFVSFTSHSSNGFRCYREWDYASKRIHFQVQTSRYLHPKTPSPAFLLFRESRRVRITSLFDKRPHRRCLHLLRRRTHR